jgi:hypothetical protein
MLIVLANCHIERLPQGGLFLWSKNLCFTTIFTTTLHYGSTNLHGLGVIERMVSEKRKPNRFRRLLQE